MSGLLLYVPRESPRLLYVLNEVFGRRLCVDFETCTDAEVFSAHSGPRIFYSPTPPVEEICWIPATSFLFEEGLSPFQPEIGKHRGVPCLFPVSDAGGHDWPFDVFSAMFYQLSRYEEYLDSRRDQHGRFPAAASLAFRHGFLELPLVDTWVAQLADYLENAFPGWELSRPAFSFCPTFDIDQAWAFRNKPVWRQAGGWAQDLLHGRFRLFLERMTVWMGWQPDPFDTFFYILDTHAQKGWRPLFFFLVGDPGPFDKNNPPERPDFRKLVAHIAGKAPVGLHPSYRSAGAPGHIAVEKKRLEEMAGRRIMQSRQHFLRLQLPQTYQQLIRAGFEADYSMGYAEAPGFRAGTARPFLWYDLENEMPTSLLVHPFQVMDVTLKNYLGLSPEAAIDRVRNLIAVTRETGGVFTTIWHNSSFHEAGGWRGWKVVYEAMLDILKTVPGQCPK